MNKEVRWNKNMKKTRVQKSRDTVPLTTKWQTYFSQSLLENACFQAKIEKLMGIIFLNPKEAEATWHNFKV